MKPFATLRQPGQVARMRRLAGAALAAYELHPRRNVGEVRSELRWLATLRRETGLAVPEPVATRDGEPLTVAEVPGVPGPRVAVLLRWAGVPGK